MVPFNAGQFRRQCCAFGLLAGLCFGLGRGCQILQFLLDGCDVGVDGLIEQTGLASIELFAAAPELAKRLRTAISCVSWSILAWR